MDVELVLEKGATQAQTFRLRSSETIIGRRQGCDLRIPLESISRRHCRLSYRDDFLSVEDLASANGTFVNGERIQKPQVLRPGDRLTLGGLTFVINYQLTQTASAQLVEEDTTAPTEHLSAPAAEEVIEGIPVPDETDMITPAVASAQPAANPRKVQKKKASQSEEQKTALHGNDDEENNPDASTLLNENGPWEMPSGDDIRDILSRIEKE